MLIAEVLDKLEMLRSTMLDLLNPTLAYSLTLSLKKTELRWKSRYFA